MFTCIISLQTGLFLSYFDGVPGRPGKSQKEGQEDQGEVKELGRSPPLGLLGSPGSPGLPSGSSLASLELHQTGLRRALLQREQPLIKLQEKYVDGLGWPNMNYKDPH